MTFSNRIGCDSNSSGSTIHNTFILMKNHVFHFIDKTIKAKCCLNVTHSIITLFGMYCAWNKTCKFILVFRTVLSSFDKYFNLAN